MSSSDYDSDKDVGDQDEEAEFFDPTTRRPHMTKASAWMGVFGEDDDEVPEKRGVSVKPLNSNLRFVKVNDPPDSVASDSASAEDTPQPRQRDEEVEIEDYKPTFSKPSFNSFDNPEPVKPTFARNMKEKTLPTKPNSTKQNVSSQLPKKDYAAFLNNPQGSIIKNMMAKMGFQEGQGLGPDGSGRVEPIEVKLRGKKVGIGFGAQESPVRESSPESEEPEELTPANRTSRPKRSKIQYKNLEEAMARVETFIPKVLDMTGAETKELGSIRDSASFNATSATLGDDIRLVIDLSKDSLLHLEQEMKNLNLQRRALVQEVETLQPLLEQSKDDEELLVSLSQLCSQFQVLALNSDPPDFVLVIPYLTKLQDHLNSISSTSQLQAFMRQKLSEVATALVQPLFCKFVSTWDLQTEPTLMSDFFKEWDKLFVTFDDLVASETGDQISETNNSMTPYDALMYHTWLPKVRSFLVNEWDPLNYEPVIILFQTWAPLLSTWLYQHVINQYLFPKLLSCLEAWNPYPGIESFHLWIHPWLPFLMDRLDEFRPIIRSKLSSIVRICEQFPPTISIPEIYFQPWLQILSSKDANKLWKGVENKLQQVMSHFVIDPSDQDIIPFMRVLSWHEFLPPAKFESVLDPFFVSWLRVLKRWLNMDPPLTEVMRWYNYWKSLLPQDSLAYPLVNSNLRQALIHINQHIDAAQTI